MQTQELIEQLIAEIAADEKLLEEKEAQLNDKRTAVRVLQARERGLGPSHVSAENVQKLANEKLPPPPRTTLTDQVTEIAEKMAETEFVVGDVYNELVARKVTLPDEPRIRIGTILNRLQGRGMLEKVFQGTGNVPNRYRFVPPSEPHSARSAYEMYK